MTDQAGVGSERSTRLGRLRARGGGSSAPADAMGRGSTDDPLTGLPGRPLLAGWVVEAVTNSRPTSSQCLLGFIDLSSLRDVNDSYGPDAGDHVLREAAARLAGFGLHGCRVLRYGGAEFAVVFEQVSGATRPAEIATALLDLLSAPYGLEVDQVSVACNVGLAIGGDTAGDSHALVRDAHHALVAARDHGPGTFLIHDESKRGRYSTRIDEARLHSALERDEFMLHYQPIVRTDTGQLIGVEALIRWQAPGATNTGLLFPHDFLPLLEKSGLIVPVGIWVLEETCRQAAAWTRDHPAVDPLFVTCNIGAHQLARPDFADTVLSALSQAGLPPRQLCLDITEQTLRYNGSSTWSALRRLSDQGVKIGLDDFGTGAASLAALRELKLDILRIDRLFIEDLAMSAEDQAIVRHVTNLAHEMEMVTVAEGIETLQQAQVLTALGVDLAQGYYYGKPEPATAIDLRLSPPDPDAPYGASSPDEILPPG